MQTSNLGMISVKDLRTIYNIIIDLLSYKTCSFAFDFTVYSMFFQIFFLVVAIGLFHGVVFLPVVLSCVGPDPRRSNLDCNLTKSDIQPSQTDKLQEVESSDSLIGVERSSVRQNVENLKLVNSTAYKSS